MENTLLDIRDEFVFPYFDGTLVFSDTFDDHLKPFKLSFSKAEEERNQDKRYK